ncbi:HlyD family type I secretion periplasmic adaptor subunit [Nordella sp. HKS 07]|uniref:HlyD family type I secretion periplasmic adaptor subunit n=1 Tax=Nordella sp. HKS 07 TaxID=2712222 RepID=UPI00352E29B7
MSRILEAYSAWHRPLNLDISRPMVAGLMAIALFIGGGGIWAATAPLSGAVIAPGVIIASGENNTVAHLEGGIIDQLLVHEGDIVTQGQVLIRLSLTAAQANLDRLVDQYNTLRAMLTRLEAERDGLEAVTFPADLSTSDNPRTQSILKGQVAEFNARRDSLASELAIYQKQIESTKEQIVGFKAQKQSADQQLELIQTETADVQRLFDQGLAPKTRLLALKRTAAQLIGVQGDITAKMAEADQQIAETESRILNAHKDWMEKTVTQLRGVEVEAGDFGERVKAARDIADRIEIKAPVRGVIVKLFYNTPGGVIAPGQPVLELLPIDKALQVEARLNPDDINIVAPGGKAQLRFPSLRKRVIPTVSGEIVYVSADRLIDRATQLPYYTVRVKPAEELPPEFDQIRLLPGMPVEVFVETGERTFLNYLVGPITETFARAFRER